MSDDEIAVTHEEGRHRFEVLVGGERAGLTAYIERDNQRIFYHTEVDEAFSGRGLASRLVHDALVQTADTGRRIVPVCPYVARYVKTHHEVDDALDPVTKEVMDVVRAEAG